MSSVRVWKHPDPDRTVLRIQYDRDEIFEVADHRLELVSVGEVPGGWIELSSVEYTPDDD